MVVSRVCGWLCLIDSVGGINSQVFQRKVGEHDRLDVSDHWTAGCLTDVLPRLLRSTFTATMIVISFAACYLLCIAVLS